MKDTLIEKKIKFSSYIRKFKMEQWQSHIWLTASSIIYGEIFLHPHILGSSSSYMTLQLLHSEFPYIWGKFNFLFYQCILSWASCFYLVFIAFLNWENICGGIHSLRCINMEDKVSKHKPISAGFCNFCTYILKIYCTELNLMILFIAFLNQPWKYLWRTKGKCNCDS